MMKRTQLYLAGLLVAQIGLILAFRSPFSSASAGYESRLLLPALETITPTRIEVQGSAEEKIEMTRREGGWRIEGLGGFPADGDKVERLLTDLKGLRVRRPVVSSGRYHEAFKVADKDHEARIRLWDASGDPDVDLLVGSSANFRTSHVRIAGEAAVYEIRGLSAYDVRPDGGTWIERELVGTDAAGVVGMRLTNAAGSFELARRDGAWTVISPEGAGKRPLDQAKVDELVRTASSIQLSDASGPVDETAQGFGRPAATLVLRWAAAEESDTDAPPRETTVQVGDKVQDNESQRYVTRQGFGYAGTVWESSVDRLITGKLDELYGS